jgi:predicted esterase
MSQNIHAGQPLFVRGTRLNDAHAAMIMIHGRGATAESILDLSEEFHQPGFAYLAPQAAGGQWYPFRFLEPVERNEPYLSSALAVITNLIGRVNEAGIPTEKIVLLGFSQGACLALEYAGRTAARYGGVVGLSGGLIGDSVSVADYPGTLDGTPVFLGCSDTDFHIPQERVNLSAIILRQLGGSVTKRIYPGMGHTVNGDELDFVEDMMKSVIGTTGGT